MRSSDVNDHTCETGSEKGIGVNLLLTQRMCPHSRQ